MFLCTLSVLVSLVMANSSAQRDQTAAIESRVARDRYSVPQEIRDRVPVNFAAMNLRKSRLKNQTDRSTLRHHAKVDKTPKASIKHSKPTGAMKNSSKQSKYGTRKSQARKKSNKKFRPTKKPPQFRMDSSQVTSSSSTQSPTTVPNQLSEGFTATMNLDKNTLTPGSQQPMNPISSKQNIFANINKAINALPQQIVKVSRDDLDCNDDPTKNFQNTRGPPCTFSLRWPGTGGHPAFWLNNVVPQNWQLFY